LEGLAILAAGAMVALLGMSDFAPGWTRGESREVVCHVIRENDSKGATVAQRMDRTKPSAAGRLARYLGIAVDSRRVKWRRVHNGHDSPVNSRQAFANHRPLACRRWAAPATQDGIDTTAPSFDAVRLDVGRFDILGKARGEGLAPRIMPEAHGR
jgi:hypothetical protein